MGHLSDPLKEVSINKRVDVCADSLHFNAKKNSTQSGTSAKPESTMWLYVALRSSVVAVVPVVRVPST